MNDEVSVMDNVTLTSPLFAFIYDTSTTMHDTTMRVEYMHPSVIPCMTMTTRERRTVTTPGGGPL